MTTTIHTRMKLLACYLLLTGFLMAGCRKDRPGNDPITYGNSFALTVYTDKAMYKPGDVIQFSLNKPLAGNIKIRYRHLGETISEASLSGNSWSWTAPAADYTGYMVDLYEQLDGKEKSMPVLVWMFLPTGPAFPVMDSLPISDSWVRMR